MSLVGEFWDFMKVRKKFWLAPIIIVLVILSAFIIWQPVRLWPRRLSIRSSSEGAEERKVRQSPWHDFHAWPGG